MGDRKTLQIQQISAHPGPIAGEGMQRQSEVCKLIDTTTCIGCKACEVACVEWNDMPFQQTMFDNTYQTMPDTDWNYWNLIKFNESQHSDGSFRLAHAQAPVHALRRSGLSARVSGRRRDRAVRERHRRFPAGKLYWLPVLRFRLPFQHSEVQSDDQEGL